MDGTKDNKNRNILTETGERTSVRGCVGDDDDDDKDVDPLRVGAMDDGRPKLRTD